MKKGRIVVIALVICLIATFSIGSLAWFSHSDEVRNDFYIADSNDSSPDEIFSVKVWEDGAPENDGLVFSNILPGDKIEKTVHITNTGHYDQYVRVTITISDATVWKSIDEDIEMEDMFTGIDKTKLYGMKSAIEADRLVCVLYYSGATSQNDDFVVFDHVKIPEAMTREHAAMFGADGDPGFTIDVKAEAVQTKNVGNDVFEAFSTVGMNPILDTVFITNAEQQEAVTAKHPNCNIVLLSATP